MGFNPRAPLHLFFFHEGARACTRAFFPDFVTIRARARDQKG
jgi:hypothetical protein